MNKLVQVSIYEIVYHITSFITQKYKQSQYHISIQCKHIYIKTYYEMIYIVNTASRVIYHRVTQLTSKFAIWLSA